MADISAQVQALSIQPGDAIIIKTDRAPDDKERDMICRAVRAVAKNSAAFVFIVEHNTSIETIRDAMTNGMNDMNKRNGDLARLLTAIHGMLYPPRTADHDGRTWEFKSPHAHEQLQELSDRIRAIPDELARLDEGRKG